VYLGSQTALLIGTAQYQISVAGSGPSTIIKDSNGKDITASVSGGQLGALLKIRNTTLPGYLSQLDTMAQRIVSAVNNQLAAGIDKNGTAGTPLFTGASGSSISVNAAITADKIAAASAINPGGNDNALQLSALQNSTAVGLGAFTFTQYIGGLSSSLGRDISDATDDQTTQQQLLAQAQTLRAQSSSVSLDEEAARLVEYQRAYQATSKLISVIDNLTQTLLGLIPSAG
jgi:flagellar hook-associated protein 1 FlgK